MTSLGNSERVQKEFFISFNPPCKVTLFKRGRCPWKRIHVTDGRDRMSIKRSEKT